MRKAYYQWIVENNLESQISMNYRQFHEMLEASGQLAGMPDLIRYTGSRGCQIHDFLHALEQLNRAFNIHPAGTRLTAA